VDLVGGLLLPLILPTLGGDTAQAQALVRHMLSEYQPRSVRELRDAGEAIGFSLRSMGELARSAEPGVAAEQRNSARKWACSLSRSGDQAQRRLDDVRRAPQTVRETEPVPEAASPVAGATPAVTPGTGPLPDVPQAESAFNAAVKLLTLMKAHHEVAPPRFSKAAQQIAAQQRVVDAAWMKLEQARKRQAEAATRPETTTAAI
jgi:hypothetical protein